MFRLLSLCFALSLILANRAHAVSVDLVFTQSSGSGTTGSSEITAAPGDILSLEIRLSAADCCGGGLGDRLGSYTIGLRFDSDLRDELDLLDVTNLPPENWVSFTLSSQESNSTHQGSTGPFSGDWYPNGGVGFPPGFVTIGIARFQVTSNVKTDGADIVSTGGFCDDGGICPVGALAADTASVNVATPEPEGLWLFCFGSILVAAKRKMLRAREMRPGQQQT